MKHSRNKVQKHIELKLGINSNAKLNQHFIFIDLDYKQTVLINGQETDVLIRK